MQKQAKTEYANKVKMLILATIVMKIRGLVKLINML